MKWVLFTDFTPLKYFADNLQEMIGARGMSWMRATGKALKLYARELLRVVFSRILCFLSAWRLLGLSWGAFEAACVGSGRSEKL